MATKIFDAYTAYLELIRTAVGDNATVYDGPQPVTPTDFDFIVVGADEVVVDGMVTSVDAGQQDWIDLGAYSRDETFTIPSMYVSWAGSTDLAACRARAEAQIAAIESALRPSPAGTGDGMLNGALAAGTRYGWCGVSITRLQQIQAAEGAATHTQFVLACRVGI
jgi:hypothetical protein